MKTISTKSQAIKYVLADGFSIIPVDKNKRPLPGLSCVMGPPSHGRPALFQQWPGAQVTDAQGHASWSLVAPQVAPGYYVMAITASGQHDSGYLWEPGITIQG